MNNTRRNAWKAVRGLPNVVSIGIGYRRVYGKKINSIGLIIGVVKKVPDRKLKPKERIPRYLHGVTTDVVETGVIRAFQDPEFDPTENHRPCPPGASIGHIDVTAGTFGCVVYTEGNDPLILSNNHVLANSNRGSVGDPIYQPGPYDGGVGPGDRIGTLEKFVPIEFSEGDATCPIARTSAKVANLAAKVTGRAHRLKAVRSSATFNLVDAATAFPDNPADIVPEIPVIGRPTGGHVGDILDLSVHKYGRTTKYTAGVVEQTDAIVTVSYGDGKSAIFEDQIITSAMSEGGDSGSVVLHRDTNATVGLLFAGSSQMTILNRIQNVFSALGVHL